MTIITPLPPTAQPAIDPDPLKGGGIYGWDDIMTRAYGLDQTQDRDGP